MKKKNLEELKNKSIKQLKDIISDLEKEIMTAKIERSQSKIKNVHAVNRKRRDIAQIKTIKQAKVFLEKKEVFDAAG